MLGTIAALILVIGGNHHHPKRPTPPQPKLPPDYVAWTRVANCESGGWKVLGYAYPNSLGINRYNYKRFGGVPQPFGYVSLKNRILQIKVADRLIAAYGASIPDQYGCGAW